MRNEALNGNPQTAANSATVRRSGLSITCNSCASTIYNARYNACKLDTHDSRASTIYNARYNARKLDTHDSRASTIYNACARTACSLYSIPKGLDKIARGCARQFARYPGSGTRKSCSLKGNDKEKPRPACETKNVNTQQRPLRAFFAALHAINASAPRALPVFLISILYCLSCNPALAFDLRDPVATKTRQGNDLLQRGKLDEAIDQYKQAQVDAPEKPELYYNLGVAMAKQEKIDDAIKSFESAAQDETQNKNNGKARLANTGLRQNNAYNLGWSYLQKGMKAKEANDSPSATESFENALKWNHDALRLAPKDRQAKHNYELAKQLLAELKKEQQEQDQNKQEEQNKEEEKKQEEQNKQQQPQSQPQQNQQPQQQDQQQNQQGNATPTPTPTPAPSPAPSQNQQNQQEQPRQQNEQKQANQNTRQMEEKKASEEEAERILQQLDDEDAKQFQQLFVPERIEQRRWVRDW